MNDILQSLAPLDWVIVMVLTASVLIGLWRGFIYELLALANWGQAGVLASLFGRDLSGLIGLGSWTPQAQQVLGFVLLFVLMLLVGGWLASQVRGWVSRSGLRAPDRALGGLFGVLRGSLILILAAMLIHGMGLQTSAWWTESKGASWLDQGVVVLRSLWAQPLPEAKG